MEDISAFKQNSKLELSGSQALQSYKNETQITEAKPLKWSHLVAERSIKFGRNILISIRKINLILFQMQINLCIESTALTAFTEDITYSLPGEEELKTLDGNLIL